MINAVRFWILFSTALVAGGWILSALHQLNRAGYAALLAPFFLGVLFFSCQRGVISPAGIRRGARKWRKRFRRGAPRLFLLLAGLAFLGGALYPAVNYDANAYRLPRVMHWLWAGQWHWIHTFDARMNIAACGMEWLEAPLILFSGSDRLLFLVNWVSYLMLPGLLFSVFARLQAAPRVAWWWAWWLSAGLCFVLQAGSIANDSFAAIYALAAVDLALRAARTASVFDLWLSLLAVALMTGAKQSNLPLAGLWLIAAWPARALIRRNLAGTGVAVLLALGVSVVPISFFNYLHFGTWMPLEVPGIATLGKFQLNPFWGLVGNAFCIPLQNLVPPFYSLMPPFHSYWPVLWNEGVRHFLQTPFGAGFRSFESFGFLSEAYYHGLCEGNAGIGLGVCLLIPATMLGIRRLKKRGIRLRRNVAPDRLAQWLRLAPYGALFIFMARIGTFENARQLAPYYPFLFPLWLCREGQSQAARDPQWQRLGIQLMAVAAVLVAFITERPLFPAQTVFRWVHAAFPKSDFLQDECGHYHDSIYRVTLGRRDYLAGQLPRDERLIGYFDKLASPDEPGVWLPYGRHGVYCLLPEESPADLRQRGIHYVVVTGGTMRNTYGAITNWAARYHAAVVGEYVFPRLDPPPGPEADLYLMRLN